MFFNKSSIGRHHEHNSKTTSIKMLTRVMHNSKCEALNDVKDDGVIYLDKNDLGTTYSPTPVLNWDRYLQTELESYKAKMTNYVPTKLSLSDFKFVKLIGEGAFGRVNLTVNRETNIFYATKIIKKKTIYEKDMIRHILNEKLILQSIRFPFTLYLEYFFQTSKNMYFIMPLAIGGDLTKIMQDCGGRFTEETAAFYSAQILLAIEYLHFMSLIYRDLKPKNVLIDHLGYIKLADFGFCKSLNNNRAYTLCGTIEYLAPEILSKSGYGEAIDLWAFGVLIYELCCGTTPFCNIRATKILDNIVQGRYNCPTYFTELLQDLVWNLLQKDENERFKLINIKRHKWFKNISWLPLLNRQIEPPIMPKISIAIKVNESIEIDAESEEDIELNNFFKSFG